MIDKMLKVLDELWRAGHEILNVYYPEEVAPGEREWSVDVYQDNINERCHLNWTWTVVSKKQLEIDADTESDRPDWVVVVEEPFSDEVVCKAIEGWLRDRGCEFRVRMVSLDQVRGSGLVKALREMDIESELRNAVPIEEAMRELSKNRKGHFKYRL